MAVLIVGLRGDGAESKGSVRTVNVGAAGSVDLMSQGVELDGIHWYSAEVNDDDTDSVIQALLGRPDVESAYRQPPAAPAS